MKAYITFIIILLCITFTQAQLQTPDLSPSAILKQTVGLTDIEIHYSRPSMKGRVIFGEKALLPYDEFWRLGANAAIKISFSRDITLAGVKVEKGSYSMLVKPFERKWVFYIYPYESADWNTYVNQIPITQLTVPVKKKKDLKETFEISIQDITSSSASIEFHWEHTQVNVPFELATQEMVMQNIDQTMKGPSFNDYFQAALYMHENKIDLPKALTYIQKVTSSEKALFFVVYREALILKDLKRKKEALFSAQRSLKLSQKADNKDFIRLNKRLIKELH